MINLKFSDSIIYFHFMMMEKTFVIAERERERERERKRGKANNISIKLYVFIRIIIPALHLRYVDIHPP